mmetsp:Transcript_132763/g.383832  ORF Transcript_132763/g.383832 Transcript_132763/m.383832 type:complete len:246 (-) Transcript_132763:268-1005(-)
MHSTISAWRRWMGRDSTARERKAHVEKQQAEPSLHKSDQEATGRRVAESCHRDRCLSNNGDVVGGLVAVHSRDAVAASGAAQETEEMGKEPFDVEASAGVAAKATVALKRLEKSVQRRKALLEEQGATCLPPSTSKEVELLLFEIAERKAQMLTGRQRSKGERISTRRAPRHSHEQYEHPGTEREWKERMRIEAVRAKLVCLRTELDAHKQKLRDEGLGREDGRRQQIIAEFEKHVVVLQRMVGD